MVIFDRFDILRMADVRSVADSFDRSKLLENHSLATKTLGSFDRSQLIETQSLASKALGSVDRLGLLETQSLAMKVVDSLDRSKLFENQSLATKALDSLDRSKLLEKNQSLESFDKSMFLQVQAMARLMERVADPLNMDFSDILLHGDTTVSISGDIVETSSYEDKIVDLFDETSDINEFFDQVSTWISGLKTDKLKKIASFLVLNIFVPYLLAVVATQTTPFFPNYWADSSQDVDIRVRKKELIREISEQYLRKN